MDAIIRLEGITKKFGHIKAIRGITLDLLEGQKTSLFGPNGAGKSTLLRIISTQMIPSSGKVYIMGKDAQKNKINAKKEIGVVGHNSFLYDELTVYENLKFYGSFVDVTIKEIDRIMGITDIEKWRDTKAGHLSYGLRKRTDISRALLGEPKILLLDEFFAGLDRVASRSLIKYMQDLNEKTIIATSHTPELVNSFCDKSIQIKNGLIEKEEKL
jgi:ABC-type multidrug transport system ATPase subunit